MVKRRRRLAPSEPVVRSELLTAIEESSQPLQSPADLDPLLERIGDARWLH